MILITHFVSCITDTILFLFMLKYIADTMIFFSKRTYLSIIALALIGAILDTLTNSNMGMMSVIILFPLCLQFIHSEGSIIRKISQYGFILLLYISLSILSVFIELILISSLFGESDTNLRFLLITIAINTLIILGIWKLCSKQNLRIWFSFRDKLLLLFVNIVTFLILAAVIQFNQQILAKDMKEQILIIVLNYSVILFYIFFVLFLVTGKVASHFKEIGRISQNHMAEQLKYFSSYKAAQEETRQFRHDMKNHLLYLQALSNENKTVEMQSYIQDLTAKWEESSTLYTTGNDVVDTIINAKQFLFKDKQIAFYLSGNFIDKLPMTPIDLCTIFANAIDNAIEANDYVAKNTTHYLNFDIKTSHNYYLVTLENSIATSVTIKNNRVISSKKNIRNHGFGLSNIEQTLQKYGGYMKLTSTPKKFILEMVFPC